MVRYPTHGARRPDLYTSEPLNRINLKPEERTLSMTGLKDGSWSSSGIRAWVWINPTMHQDSTINSGAIAFHLSTVTQGTSLATTTGKAIAQNKI